MSVGAGKVLELFFPIIVILRQRRETIVDVRDGLIWKLATGLMLCIRCRHHMELSGYVTPWIYSLGVRPVQEVYTTHEDRSKGRVKAIPGHEGSIRPPAKTLL